MAHDREQLVSLGHVHANAFAKILDFTESFLQRLAQLEDLAIRARVRARIGFPAGSRVECIGADGAHRVLSRH